jgi:hypothetical protein
MAASTPAVRWPRVRAKPQLFRGCSRELYDTVPQQETADGVDKPMIDLGSGDPLEPERSLPAWRRCPNLAPVRDSTVIVSWAQRRTVIINDRSV